MSQAWYIQFIITLIPSLIVAVVTALVTVRLSLRKFYTERWWERKADAYSRIVEALHKHKNYAEQKLEIELNRSKGKGKQLEMQWADAHAELKRASDLGAFVISRKAEEIIKKFLSRATGDPNNDLLTEIIEADLIQVEKCLKAIKHVAQKDLGL